MCYFAWKLELVQIFCELLNTNSNMQNSMVMFTFSVFDQEYAFWANLVQKIKIVSSGWNLILKLIQIFRIHFFVFDREYSFGTNLVQKSNNKLKLKFGTYANSNMQSSMECPLFLFLIGNTLFGQFGPKSQNYQFKLKFGTWTNSNIQNSIAVFTF